MNSTKRRALHMSGGLSPAQLKEITFQSEKAKRAKLQAITDNAVLDSEIKAGERESAASMDARQTSLDIARITEKLKVQKILSRAPSCSFRGLRCFVAPGISGVDMGPSMSKHGLVPEEHRVDADLFVVLNPSDPGQRIRWVAALKGARVAHPRYVISGGRRGACVKYHAAVETKRSLWISEDFRAKHATLADIVDACCAGSKWKLLVSRAEFAATVSRSMRGKATAGKSVLALVAKAELSPLFQQLGCVFLADTFLDVDGSARPAGPLSTPGMNSWNSVLSPREK